MNKQKLTYVSPETETLVIRFEGVVCSSPFNSGTSTEYYGEIDGGDL